MTEFTSVQIVVQLFMVMNGFLVVRFLSPREFAYYTIALSMQVTMELLANMGILAGMSAIGGRVWQDRSRLGQLIKTALGLRYRLGVAAVAVVGPILVSLLLRNGAPVSLVAAILLVIVTSLFLQLTTLVLIVVLRLHSQLRRIQQLDFSAAALRLLLLVLACSFAPSAVAILAVAGLVTLFQALVVRRWAGESADPEETTNAEDRTTIVSLIKHGAPNTIFYCLQGQIVVLLISIYGSAQEVAEVGALGRLAVLYSVVTAVMTSVVMPHFARCQEGAVLRRRYLQTLLFYATLGGGMVLFAMTFPDLLLWLFGKPYAGLHKELVLMMAASAIQSFVVSMWLLNSARGWIRGAWLNIPGTLAIQVITLGFLDVSTVPGVLWFNIISVVPNLAVNAMLSYRGFQSIERGDDDEEVMSEGMMPPAVIVAEAAPLSDPSLGREARSI